MHEGFAPHYKDRIYIGCVLLHCRALACVKRFEAKAEGWGFLSISICGSPWPSLHLFVNNFISFWVFFLIK